MFQEWVEHVALECCSITISWNKHTWDIHICCNVPKACFKPSKLMHVWMMLMFMKCKCNYASLTPRVLHCIASLGSKLNQSVGNLLNGTAVGEATFSWRVWLPFHWKNRGTAAHSDHCHQCEPCRPAALLLSVKCLGSLQRGGGRSDMPTLQDLGSRSLCKFFQRDK